MQAGDVLNFCMRPCGQWDEGIDVSDQRSKRFKLTLPTGTAATCRTKCFKKSTMPGFATIGPALVSIGIPRHIVIGLGLPMMAVL